MIAAAPPAAPNRRPHSGPVPLGTIRVYDGVRRIKVATTGPRRWVDYARWWWINNKGPVPRGMRVVHLDGDKLNDDPANLACVTPGDHVFLWHDRNPDLSADAYRKCHAAAGERNRIVALTRRLREYLPSRWYPVDHEARVIYNTPKKVRFHVWLNFVPGIQQAIRPNGEGGDAAALGWPSIPAVDAMVLHALGLANGHPQTTAQLAEALRLIRKERGLPPNGDRFIYQITSRLGLAGMVVSRRDGRPNKLFRITERAYEKRGPWTHIVPVRGRDLSGEAFEGYEKRDPEFGSRRRLAPRDSLALLAQAIGGAA
ncbi:MAG: HNH endonuclease signature motif containing protein [Phycisphaerales bacterium]